MTLAVGAEEPSGSPRSQGRELWQAAQAIATLSGALLILAYITGRLYVQFFYYPFGADVNDLGLSVQDIAFQSGNIILLPVGIAIGALAGFTMGRLKKLRDVLRRELKKPSWLDRRVRDHPILTMSIWSLVLTLCIFMIALTHGLIYALFFAGSSLVLVVGTIVMLNLIVQYVRGELDINHFTPLMTAVIFTYVIIGTPIFGTLQGLASTHDRTPGCRLPSVTIEASEQIRQDWTKSSTGFLSPHLRLLGRTDHFLVVWVPYSTNFRVIQVPVDKIISVGEKRSICLP